MKLTAAKVEHIAQLADTFFTNRPKSEKAPSFDQLMDVREKKSRDAGGHSRRTGAADFADAGDGRHLVLFGK